MTYFLWQKRTAFQSQASLYPLFPGQCPHYLEGTNKILNRYMQVGIQSALPVTICAVSAAEVSTFGKVHLIGLSGSSSDSVENFDNNQYSLHLQRQFGPSVLVSRSNLVRPYCCVDLDSRRIILLTVRYAQVSFSLFCGLMPHA